VLGKRLKEKSERNWAAKKEKEEKERCIGRDHKGIHKNNHRTAKLEYKRRGIRGVKGLIVNSGG